MCNKPGELRRADSAVSPYRFFACRDCQGKEPRWLLVMQARHAGIESIQQALKSHAYVGEELKAVELLG